VKTAKLVPGTPLTLQATLEGKLTVAGAPHCKDLVAPAECVLAPGTYNVDFVATGTKATHKVKVGTKPVTERFEFGHVEAADGKQIMLGGKAMKKALFEAGLRTVTVADDAGTHNVQVRVKANGTVTAK
ncbi:MAG TPA: hypothetical protein VFS15_10900, partial [Kofleriaceae bacterium]|nr:hypothetical protein [Kofleriaceae bacterium]